MKIKQVEELVGITKKNIRFYEEQGLLFPERLDNGYREYRLEDIECLKQIKLLRKLGVSIEEIHKVMQGKRRLDDCVDHQLDVLERQKESITKMQELGERMIRNHSSLAELPVDDYLDMVEQMEKEGACFMNVEQTDRRRRKKIGAVGGGLFMILSCVLSMGAILWANTQEDIPIVVMALLIGLPSIIMICVIVAVISRVKEIKGGEEDEASKY